MPSGHQLIFGLLLGVMVLWSPQGLLPLLARLAPSRNGKEAGHAG
jgi:branched-chain amino acid transport system permease protein